MQSPGCVVYKTAPVGFSKAYFLLALLCRVWLLFIQAPIYIARLGTWHHIASVLTYNLSLTSSTITYLAPARFNRHHGPPLKHHP